MILADCQLQHKSQHQVIMCSRTLNNTMQHQRTISSVRQDTDCGQQQVSQQQQQQQQPQQQQQSHYNIHQHDPMQHTQMHYANTDACHQHTNSYHSLQQQQQQQQHQQEQQQQHQSYTRPALSQQQASSGHQLLASVHAPPTPPSDEQLAQTVTHIVHDSRHRIQSSRVQTGAWVMQTIQIQQQQQQQQQQNSMQEVLTAPHNQHQQTNISSYYYDIDDGFSDIMSAPGTPEPVQMISQQQQHTDNYHYNNYLPYHQVTHHSEHNHRHLQQEIPAGNNNNNNVQLEFDSVNRHQEQSQQQQQHFYQTQVQSQGAQSLQPSSLSYAIAMSPDSSSLSTTSSSPSDHSLYQASPPMPSLSVGSFQLGPPSDGGQQAGSVHSRAAGAEHVFGSNLSQTSGQLVLKPIKQQIDSQRNELAAKPLQSAATANLNNNHNHHHHHHHHHRSSPIHLWEFLKELLQQVESGSADATIIRWLDRQRGVFKIEDSVRVAKLWGKRKNKPRMNYDKLSRSIRQYYKKGIMKKTDRSQRLVYQFCSAYCH